MKQAYEEYTKENHLVWKTLFERQIVLLPKAATKEYLKGIEIIKFTQDHIPNFEQTNALLRDATGWEIAVVPGLIPDKEFFELLSNKKFPASTWLRKMEELDYLEEPDMFHDVFAHVPLLTNQAFVNFLQELSQIALEHIDNPLAIDLLSRIYWFTVEFGLIHEEEGLRIYGAGILSSAGETVFCLGDTPPRYDYNVSQILNTPYRKDVFQDRYFVIDSYEQLYTSIQDIKTALNKILSEKKMSTD